MADRLGSRLRVGVVVPAFNTVVQPELEAMRPDGVTNHVSRIEMPDTPLTSDAEQQAVIDSLGPDLDGSLRRVLGARPHVVVFGISIPTFWTGVAGMHEMRDRLEAQAGVPVVLGSEAVLEALAQLPGRPRIGVVTPYQPIADAKVRAFLEEAGHEVAAVESLLPARSSMIAAVEAEQFTATVDNLVRHGAEVVLQVGTNLAVTDLVDALSTRLGLPVIAINTALYWLALRRAGVEVRRSGFGPPLDHA